MKLSNRKPLVKNDELTKTFNKDFAETVETLNTFEWPQNNTDLLNNQFTAIIKKFQNQASMMKLKSKCGFTSQMITDCINNVLSQDTFPESLKFANITPVHKKDKVSGNQNYRPVSVLPLLSKIFRKVIYDQLSQYLDKYLNSLLCGFRKAHFSQHALFKLLLA